MTSNNDFERRIRNLDGQLKELEQRIAAGEVTSPAVITMARGLREALDLYFQSGNNGPASDQASGLADMSGTEP